MPKHRYRWLLLADIYRMRLFWAMARRLAALPVAAE